MNDYFFTADEHYGHKNIIKYCNRPFTNVQEMDETIISNLNKVVKSNDTVVHLGDFCLASKKYGDVMDKYISKLNGNHIFIPGSHDYWLPQNKISHIWQKAFGKQQVVCCHYAMRTWPASHWGSWHLYGHSHGKLPGIGKSMDVGVDVHNFAPWSFDEIAEKLMDKSFVEVAENFSKAVNLPK